jgi:hypothetical protein
MSDITIGASSISGFNSTNIGADVSLTGLGVTLSSATVTGTFRAQWIGMGGFKITFSTGVTYTVASVDSASSLTLTANYAESSGTVTGTWRKYAVLRVYVTTPFVPSGETYVAQSGAPGSSVWFRRYAVPVIHDGQQNVAYVPQIVLPATTNSSVPTARYFAGIYTPGGAFVQAFPGSVSEFRLDSTTTPTSWAQITTFNSPPNPGPPDPVNYYTTQQIDARFPSGTVNKMLYYAATGNVLSLLTLGAEFAIAGGTLSLTGAAGVNRVQEEGSNLPQRQTINFVGSAFTATDDAGNTRTNVTADADLNALASNASNGFWAAGTNIVRTLTGTANEIGITNGNGTVGNPVFSLPAALTFTGKTVTGGTFATPTITTPGISGGTHTALTGLGIRSTGSGAFDLTLANTENLTAGRTLTLTLNDAARTVTQRM